MGGTRFQSLWVAVYLNNDDIICLLGCSKDLGKKGLIQKLKARKEKSKLDKIEKMKSTLRKQGLIVNEEVKGIEIESNKQEPAEPMVKFYGKEALPAV